LSGESVYQLLAGADSNKDHFLCQLSQEQLTIIISYWELTKPEVRNCCENGISYRRKEDSCLCFIGSGLPEFCNKIRAKEGAIIQIDKDHSIYSTESQQELSSKESLVLASKKRHTPLTWVLVWETSGCPLLLQLDKGKV
jgi:hypothetical protein